MMRRLRSAKLVVTLSVALLVLGGSAAHASPISLAHTERTVAMQQLRRGDSAVSVHSVPRPWGAVAARRKSRERITDSANLLTPSDRARLTERILAAESRSDSEIVLVTLPTVEGRDQKQFATQLFNKWDVGSKAANKKGVLVLFVKDGGARGKGRIQVAVSRSLNGAVSTAWTNSMLEASVLPRLRTRDYSGGFERCVQRLEPRLVKRGGGEFDDALISTAVLGAVVAAAGVQSWHDDRSSRTCDECGAICERERCDPWEEVRAATDEEEGWRHRKIVCHKCGQVSLKRRAIRKYDGRRRLSDGTWQYYYNSSDGDGGGSDGGGGGGGDC